MATFDGKHPATRPGLVALQLEVCVSWLDGDGHHVIVCPPYKKAVTVTRSERQSILRAIHLAAEFAADYLHQEFAKHDGAAD
jgi:hypothetical protein